MKYSILWSFLLFGGLLTLANSVEAHDKMKTLSEKEKQIVAVSALAARGNLPELKKALSEGLDAGVSVNEFKEILVQTYAYCGFPRSLNALGTLMTVVEERKKRGIQDVEGKLPGPAPVGKSLDFGTDNQTKLCGAPVKGPLFEFAPAIDDYLKSHLFGDIFARDNLDWKTREMATIAMLAAMSGVEPQLAAHIRIGKTNGLTDEQVVTILNLVRNQKSGCQNPSPFPIGTENSGFAQYFSGKSFLAPLATNKELNVPIYNVTFEPGCRNNWHKHTGGQILIAVGGVGYYQERGKTAVRMIPGDIVEIPVNVEHWHGAAPDSWFSHLALECNPLTNKNTWLEPVSQEHYISVTAPKAIPAKSPVVRLSKIRVDADKLDSYNAFLTEGITASMNLEPGVLTLYAVAEKDDPTRITILEIYADEEAYKSHLLTPHFLKYKIGTQEMVHELQLSDTIPFIPELKIK